MHHMGLPVFGWATRNCGCCYWTNGGCMISPWGGGPGTHTLSLILSILSHNAFYQSIHSRTPSIYPLITPSNMLSQCTLPIHPLNAPPWQCILSIHTLSMHPLNHPLSTFYPPLSTAWLPWPIGCPPVLCYRGVIWWYHPNPQAPQVKPYHTTIDTPRTVHINTNT